mmetsp:Transcript_29668/g.86462  ORF Transcript_29668/g.86462 Transcript_29668/m.86462 type:complete len:121 (+) Transcript_29668:169-531(+)
MSARMAGSSLLRMSAAVGPSRLRVRNWTASASAAVGSESHPDWDQVLRVLPEVTDALSSRRPVVALESTILAHGMPYPQNLELSQEVSAILRERVRLGGDRERERERGMRCFGMHADFVF